MPEILEQNYSVSLKFDSLISHIYKPRRDFNAVVTGKKVDITYKYIPSNETYFWYIELFGTYPLRTHEPVCECSPDVVKTRQAVNVRIGYPYSQDESDVPEWAYATVKYYAPAWYPI